MDSLMDIGDRYKKQPWILGGDFNLIMSLEEKKGGV
jgi:hypothetical protein